MDTTKDFETIKTTLADYGFSCECFAINNKNKHEKADSELENETLRKMAEKRDEKYGIIIRDAHSPKFAYPTAVPFNKPELTVTFTGELSDLAGTLSFALLDVNADDMAYLMMTGKNARTESEFKDVFNKIVRRWNLPGCVKFSLAWSGNGSRWATDSNLRQDCQTFKEYARDYLGRLTDASIKLDTLQTNSKLPFSQDIVDLLTSLDIMVEDVTKLEEEETFGENDAIYLITPAAQQDEDVEFTMRTDGTEKMFVNLIRDLLVENDDKYDAEGYQFSKTLSFSDNDEYARPPIDMVDADLEFIQKIRSLYEGLADLKYYSEEA